MNIQKLVASLGLYITFLFIGHHGPFALHHKPDDHAHTHKKHTVKLLRIDEDSDLLINRHKYVPLVS